MGAQLSTQLSERAVISSVQGDLSSKEDHKYTWRVFADPFAVQLKIGYKDTDDSQHNDLLAILKCTLRLNCYTSGTPDFQYLKRWGELNVKEVLRGATEDKFLSQVTVVGVRKEDSQILLDVALQIGIVAQLQMALVMRWQLTGALQPDSVKPAIRDHTHLLEGPLHELLNELDQDALEIITFALAGKPLQKELLFFRESAGINEPMPAELRHSIAVALCGVELTWLLYCSALLRAIRSGAGTMFSVPPIGQHQDQPRVQLFCGMPLRAVLLISKLDSERAIKQFLHKRSTGFSVKVLVVLLEENATITSYEQLMSKAIEFLVLDPRGSLEEVDLPIPVHPPVVCQGKSGVVAKCELCLFFLAVNMRATRTPQESGAGDRQLISPVGPAPDVSEEEMFIGAPGPGTPGPWSRPATPQRTSSQDAPSPTPTAPVEAPTPEVSTKKDATKSSKFRRVRTEPLQVSPEKAENKLANKSLPLKKGKKSKLSSSSVGATDHTQKNKLCRDFASTVLNLHANLD